jgi:hypothetical protein
MKLRSARAHGYSHGFLQKCPRRAGSMNLKARIHHVHEIFPSPDIDWMLNDRAQRPNLSGISGLPLQGNSCNDIIRNTRIYP